MNRTVNENILKAIDALKEAEKLMAEARYKKDQAEHDIVKELVERRDYHFLKPRNLHYLARQLERD